MPEIEGFAERIFSLRRSANKNQEELGTALGLTKSGISSFEKGKSIPSPENLVKLALLFKVSVDYLLTGKHSIIEAEGSKERISSNLSSTHSVQSDTEPRVVGTPSARNPKEEQAERVSTEEDTLDEIRVLLKQVLAERELRRFKEAKSAIKHYEQFLPDELPVSLTPLPDFDRTQMDMRFLTELDRLLKAQVFPTYEVWAHAVGVNPNNVAGIEKGRYHFNIELLYNTLRFYPAFDYIYVVFGSAWSDRPEPTEFPKRMRGPQPKVTS